MVKQMKILKVKKQGDGLAFYLRKEDVADLQLHHGDSRYYFYDDSNPSLGVISKDLDTRAIELVLGESAMAEYGLNVARTMLETLDEMIKEHGDDEDLLNRLSWQRTCIIEILSWFNSAVNGAGAQFPELKRKTLEQRRVQEARRAGGPGTTRTVKPEKKKPDPGVVGSGETEI